jgi:hypothetical protein
MDTRGKNRMNFLGKERKKTGQQVGENREKVKLCDAWSPVKSQHQENPRNMVPEVKGHHFLCCNK